MTDPAQTESENISGNNEPLASTSTVPTLLSCKTWLMTNPAYHLHDAIENCKVVCDPQNDKKRHTQS